MKAEVFDLIIVGGGAAGFFAAIKVTERRPDMRILMLEKSSKLLAKVKVSGGGRCNVTHSCFNPFQLADHYPRGERALKQMFKVFQASDMVEWLRTKGIALKAEMDGRMFPVTDDSQTIIDTFLRLSIGNGVKTLLQTAVLGVEKNDSGEIKVTCDGGVEFLARKVLVAAGGSPKPESYRWLQTCGHNIVKPVPSLFTFNDEGKEFVDLMGVAVASAEVKIIGTKFSERGPVLITHWGLSGPAVIKLSAWAATALFEANYVFDIHVNWTTYAKEEEVRSELMNFKSMKPKQRIFSNSPFAIPARLWEKFCVRSEIGVERVWGEIANKNLNKLLENLYRCSFSIRGKTTFKEEFVTCGGVDLKDVDLKSMESKHVKNVYFAGEVLNIDGETGGFNFQAAWTTAYIAASSIVKDSPAI